MQRILVVFQATEAKTEGLALAFGLGAVEGGANIRLRHLPGKVPAALEHQGYGHIRKEDIEWAEVIGLGIEAPEPAGELKTFIEHVSDCEKTADLSTKLVYLFGSASKTPSMLFAENALQKSGISSVSTEIADVSSDAEYVQAVGRKLAELNSRSS